MDEVYSILLILSECQRSLASVIGVVVYGAFLFIVGLVTVT